MKCIICSKEVPKQYEWRAGKFCGRKCYLEYHKAKKEVRQCLYCLKEFEVFTRNKKQFCSLKCRYEKAKKNGSRYLGVNGYWYIKDNGKYYLEHRFLLEKHLKRRLEKNEYCHHINGVKTDNRMENLRLFNGNSSHSKYHSQQYSVMPINKPKAIVKRWETRRKMVNKRVL